MDDTDDVAIGVIGCGNWGTNHLRVWDELGHLAAACDLDPARRDRVANRFPGVDLHDSPKGVLSRGDVDAVVVATPSETHAELARAALESGKDALVEKPMALDPGVGRELVELADERDRVLGVGHVLEYHPAVRKLKQLVADGELGKVQYIYGNRLNLGTIRTAENALWSFAPHDVSIILRLLEQMPTEVECSGGAYLDQDVADVTLTSLTFPGQVRAHIFVSWLHPFKEHRFTVVGDEQMAVFDDTKPWDEKLVLYPHRVDWVDGRVPVAEKAEAVPVEIDEDEPLEAECRDFARAVRERRDPLSDGERGVHVLEILEAAQAALDDGSTPEPSTPAEGVHEAAFVHETAHVDEGATIGADTSVWHNVHVMEDAAIGEGCTLGQNVYVGRGVPVGDGVKIQNNVSVYDGVRLEDDVFCGPSAVFTNVINPRSEVERKDAFQPTPVRQGATIGANATILCGNEIGRYAFVAAGAVVTDDVPAFALVKGSPARVDGWRCACGDPISFDGDEGACTSCDRTYRREDDEVAPA